MAGGADDGADEAAASTSGSGSHPTRAQGLRHFLDSHQYATDNVLRYEAVYGRGFSSPGGAESAAELSAMLQLQVCGSGEGIGVVVVEPVYLHLQERETLRA